MSCWSDEYLATVIQTVLRGRRGGRQGEVHLRSNVGYWIRLARADGVVTGRLITNTYYVPENPLTLRQVRAVQQLGWSPLLGAARVRPGTVTHETMWPARTLSSEIAASVGKVIDDVLRVPRATVELWEGEPAPPGEPSFPHAILFWNDFVPFDDFSRAANSLIANGAKTVYFNDATEDSTYKVVIASVQLSPAEASEIYHVSDREMTEDATGWVSWEC